MDDLGVPLFQETFISTNKADRCSCRFSHSTKTLHLGHLGIDFSVTNISFHNTQTTLLYIYSTVVRDFVRFFDTKFQALNF